MSDMLSQDEINALLSGLNNNDDEGSEASESTSNSELVIEEYLTSMEQDALGEIGNISFGSAATALSTLLNQKVDITTPIVSIVSRNELADKFPVPYVAIHVNYTEGFEGMNLLVIKTTDAAIIANLMLGGDGTETNDELGEMEISAVQEAMNQMMGSASTSMSTIFNKKVEISPPGIDLMDLKEDQGTNNIPNEEILVKISFSLKVGNLIDSQIMQLVTVSFAKDLFEQLMNPTPNDEPEPMVSAKTEQPVQHNSSNHVKEDYTQTPVHYQQQPSAPRQPQSFGGHGSVQQNDRMANVQPAAFSSFEATSLNETESKNLSMLLDIQLQVTVELGRTKQSIKEILELSQGSIIELDKLAGEPVDVLINNKLIAKGEVVVIDENFGVRVTDILSQTDRIKNLQ
ncbi:MAG: flagellar motor switch phosphatase FliY [Bacillaceae bacterium]|nr:flagellar motor switch phosphatase FliY [Bacillaceae bacterium]